MITEAAALSMTYGDRNASTLDELWMNSDGFSSLTGT